MGIRGRQLGEETAGIPGLEPLQEVGFGWALWRQQVSRRWEHKYSVQATVMERSLKRQYPQCQYEKLVILDPH